MLPRRPQERAAPPERAKEQGKGLQKRGSKVEGLTLLPAFSSPRAAPAGPKGGPGRPSSLGAAPLENLANHWEKLMFRSRRWRSP